MVKFAMVRFTFFLSQTLYRLMMEEEKNMSEIVEHVFEGFRLEEPHRHVRYHDLNASLVVLEVCCF